MYVDNLFQFIKGIAVHIYVQTVLSDDKIMNMLHSVKSSNFLQEAHGQLEAIIEALDIYRADDDPFHDIIVCLELSCGDLESSMEHQGDDAMVFDKLLENLSRIRRECRFIMNTNSMVQSSAWYEILQLCLTTAHSLSAKLEINHVPSS